MSNIPTVTFQILGPIEGAAEGSHRGYGSKFSQVRRHQKILSSV